jgi:hypothetical protein
MRDYWRQLRRGPPGLRFRNFYAYRHQRRGGSRVARVVMIALSVVLILGGVAIGWLPGPGGFIALIGAALLSAEWRHMANALDWSEVRVRRLVRRIRNDASESPGRR